MLSILNLKKTFEDGTRAVKNASFQVAKGEFVVILGPSGSGKTTLLRCINGLSETSKGKIFLDNHEISFQNPGVGNTLFNNGGGGIGNFYQGQHYEEPKEEDEDNEESGKITTL